MFVLVYNFKFYWTPTFLSYFSIHFGLPSSGSVLYSKTCFKMTSGSYPFLVLKYSSHSGIHQHSLTTCTSIILFHLAVTLSQGFSMFIKFYFWCFCLLSFYLICRLSFCTFLLVVAIVFNRLSLLTGINVIPNASRDFTLAFLNFQVSHSLLCNLFCQMFTLILFYILWGP